MQLQEIIDGYKAIQSEICYGLAQLDGKESFSVELWDRPEGGGGITRVISNGDLMEKGGVNFSYVHGPLPEVLRSEQRDAANFHATGVSIVLHSKNPFVPIIHMNIRYFEMDNGNWYFGGGIDVSPAYPNVEDTRWFHTKLKTICDQFDENYYPKFKAECDEYFTIKHRNEMRGVSGIFYDYLNDSTKTKEEIFNFSAAIGRSFVEIYQYLSTNNRLQPFGETQKHWQLIRRGRYAEFNLVYDRGTHFGLRTNGRIESILMSLPPLAVWEYNYTPQVGTPEFDTLRFFQPQDWV